MLAELIGQHFSIARERQRFNFEAFGLLTIR